MIEASCSFDDRRDEVIIAFLYDELDPATHADFSAHVAHCAVCRDEVKALKAVRTQLKAWTPPVPRRQSQVAGEQSPVVSLQSRVADRQSWWHTVPAWAQLAAALLFLGVSAAVANLDIHYNQSGLTVRTGWSGVRSAGAQAAVPAPTAVAAAPGVAGASSARQVEPVVPWRADLAALEHQLRTEFHAPRAATNTTQPSTDAELLRRVRALLDESERKQQRELALRVAEVLRDVQNERRADLVRIEQSLGQIQNNTGVEVMKQRQLLNYLVRVSSQK